MAHSQETPSHPQVERSIPELGEKLRGAIEYLTISTPYDIHTVISTGTPMLEPRDGELPKPFCVDAHLINERGKLDGSLAYHLPEGTFLLHRNAREARWNGTSAKVEARDSDLVHQLQSYSLDALLTPDSREFTHVDVNSIDESAAASLAAITKVLKDQAEQWNDKYTYVRQHITVDQNGDIVATGVTRGGAVRSRDHVYQHTFIEVETIENELRIVRRMMRNDDGSIGFDKMETTVDGDTSQTAFTLKDFAIVDHEIDLLCEDKRIRPL